MLDRVMGPLLVTFAECCNQLVGNSLNNFLDQRFFLILKNRRGFRGYCRKQTMKTETPDPQDDHDIFTIKTFFSLMRYTMSLGRNIRLLWVNKHHINQLDYHRK
jgi:hypothetical protein